jgi:hypothetical protein
VRVLPSHVVQAIERLIGPKQTDLDERRIGHFLLAKVNSILTLLDGVPTELLSLSFDDFLELTQCHEVLASAAARWVLGDIAPAHGVNGKDAVERIRRLIGQCQDEIPPPEPELPFIDESKTRAGIQSQMSTAWNNFNTSDWLASTTFAGSAMEAVLLWALKKSGVRDKRKSLDELTLSELIDVAKNEDVISESTATIAHQSKEARNLIHPGKVAREGVSCTKASALTGLAGLYRVIEDLKAAYG